MWEVGTEKIEWAIALPIAIPIPIPIPRTSPSTGFPIDDRKSEIMMSAICAEVETKESKRTLVRKLTLALDNGPHENAR